MSFFSSSKNVFQDEVLFLNEVRKGHSKAILHLQDKAEGFTKGLLEQKQLPLHLLGEVVNDACVILVKKVREADFSLQDTKLITYFFGIIKNVVLNKTRTRQYSGNVDLENQAHPSANTVEEYYSRKEHIELVGTLLNNAGQPCAEIIRLKYLDDYSDEEVVVQQLLPYSSVESLRVKRSQCLKKLKDFAKRITNH
jgi:RNA polymerase sigma factor (sigma-70 family)